MIFRVVPDVAGRAWIAILLNGVQGVECSNHSVPTKRIKHIAKAGEIRLFLFVLRAAAESAVQVGELESVLGNAVMAWQAPARRKSNSFAQVAVAECGKQCDAGLIEICRAAP